MQNRDSNWRHFLGDRCRIVRCDPVPGRIFTSERLLWALAVVIGIELLVSQVISWEVSVWVAMCGDGLRDLGVVPGPNIPQPGGGLVVAFRCRDDGAVGR